MNLLMAMPNSLCHGYPRRISSTPGGQDRARRRQDGTTSLTGNERRPRRLRGSWSSALTGTDPGLLTKS
jgi:hypothetical protein